MLIKFRMFGTGLKGHIYSIDELIKEHLSEKDNKPDFIELLKLLE